MNRFCRRMRPGLLAAFLALVAAPFVFAHAVSLWAEVADGKVVVEAFASDGAKLAGARIVVADAKGEKLIEGKTGADGKFTFDPPYEGEMLIVLMVDGGHRAEFKLSADDFKSPAAPGKGDREKGSDGD